MCEWGTSEQVEVFIPADLSRTGKARKDFKPVDACIAPLVRSLQDIGTRASCCGHGRIPGIITLGDGRELFILPDYEAGRRLNNMLSLTLYPTTMCGESMEEHFPPELVEAGKKFTRMLEDYFPWEADDE